MLHLNFKGPLYEQKNKLEVIVDKSIELTLRTLEHKMKLKNNVLVSLYNDDDWSFVIKINALIETFIRYLIEHYGDNTAMCEVAKKENKDQFVPLNGLVKIVKMYKYIDKNLLDFFIVFGKLRNRLTHNIKYLGFCFDNDLPKSLEKDIDEAFKKIGSKIFDNVPELKELYAFAARSSPDAERHPMYYQVFAAVTAMIYTIHKAVYIKGGVTELNGSCTMGTAK